MIAHKKVFDPLTIAILLIFFFLGAFYLKHQFILERQIVKKIKNSPQKEVRHFDYTIVLVGDSMTEYLGNLEELGYFLNKYYPNKHFLLLNYGYSSTNTLSLPDRIEKDSFHNNRTFQAINDINFDLILIESFGNNPPSQYPLEEDLKIQTQTLDKVISDLTQKHSKSKIVFVATIAPNKYFYGIGLVNLTPDQRQKWVSDREAFIKNHIKYAKDHQIPVIDIFDQSLNIFGDGRVDYLNPADHIHPSTVGIYFIDDNIAQFIYQNHIF